MMADDVRAGLRGQEFASMSSIWVKNCVENRHQGMRRVLTT